MYLKKIIWPVLLLLAVATVQAFHASPQSTPSSQHFIESTLIPRSLLFGNPVKAKPYLSPKGAKLAYLAPDAGNVLNVWVKDLASKAPDKKVTKDTKHGIRHYLWQYDQENILYVQDKDGDENWHLYQTNLLTDITRDLTPFEGITVGIVAYNHHFPNEMLIQMNLRNPQLHDVYRLNLMTGELKLDVENSGEVIEWIADHQLCVRATASMTSEGNTIISVREADDAPWRELMTLDALELDKGIIGFSEDDKSLFCFTSIGANTVRLIQLDIKTGQYTIIAEHSNYDLSGVLVDPSTHRLLAVGYEGDKYTLLPLDSTFAADFDWLKLQFSTPSTEAAIHLVSSDLASQTWIIAVMSDVSSTAYYLYQRTEKKIRFLFSSQPGLDAYILNPMKPISFMARDGLKLHGYLTLPANKQAKNFPLVLDVHGGPWARDSWGFNPGAQWLANRGYAVLQINFRGSTGYGKQHLNAGNREWGRKMHLDLLDGKQWAIDSGFVDPAKVAIYGGSYGGYATLAALAFTPEEFCCGVDVVGPSNLITLMQTLPPYWNPMKAQMDLRIGCLETEPDFLRECSPLFKASQITKPLLIAQGANDPRVKQAESDQIVDAMRANNLPVEYLLFPDEGHGFALPQNRMKFYAATEAFLARYLGGEAELPAAEENWESLKQ